MSTGERRKPTSAEDLRKLLDYADDHNVDLDRVLGLQRHIDQKAARQEMNDKTKYVSIGLAFLGQFAFVVYFIMMVKATADEAKSAAAEVKALATQAQIAAQTATQQSAINSVQIANIAQNIADINVSLRDINAKIPR